MKTTASTRIDIHSHVIPARMIDGIAKMPQAFAARIEGEPGAQRVIHEQGYAYPLFAEFHDVEAKLESMDRKGIDVSVVSPAPPMFYYWADVERALTDGIHGIPASVLRRDLIG